MFTCYRYKKKRDIKRLSFHLKKGGCNDAHDYHCDRIYLWYTCVTFALIYYYKTKRRNREPSVSILLLYAKITHSSHVKNPDNCFGCPRTNVFRLIIAWSSAFCFVFEKLRLTHQNIFSWDSHEVDFWQFNHILCTCASLSWMLSFLVF